MKYIIYICIISACLMSCSSLSDEQLNNRNAYMERAQKYYQNKKYMNALQQINLALEIDPEYKRALLSKGWTLYYIDNYDESEEFFLKAHEQDDADSWTHYGLASIYFKRGNKSVKDAIKIAKEIEKTKSEEKIKALRKTLAKHESTSVMWFEKSLEHFESAIAYDERIEDLHKMIAAVNISLGLPYYNKAMKSLAKPGENTNLDINVFMTKAMPRYEAAIVASDKYIAQKDKQYNSAQNFIEAKNKKREEEVLLEKEHEKIDTIIENSQLVVDQNRKDYRIAQGLASEQCFQLAVLMKGFAVYYGNQPKSKIYRELYQKYLLSSRERVENMMKTSPDIQSAYLNLARIARLDEDYQTAMKYLKEYIEKFPTANARDRVLAQQEIKQLETLVKVDKKN